MSQRICQIGLLVCVSVACAGCHQSSTPTRQRRARVAEQADQNHVSKAFEYLEKIEDYEERSALSQAAYGMNRWLDGEKTNPDWQPDPMVQRLPRSVRDRGVVKELYRERFDLDDMRYLQECVWMRQLSGWVTERPIDPLFGTWLESRRAELGDESADQLATAHQLFDWVVRNIRLDELLASPDEATAAPAVGTGENAEVAAAIPSALRGIPGPGYLFDPIQILLYGHGDAWQRMRIFTLLARQRGVTVVTLAFPGRTIPPRPRPWVSGVLIGKELYLFDPRLGLPIAGPTGGAATLTEVLTQPELLDKMEIEGRHTYDVPAEDRNEIVALMDVVEPALAQRTQLLEKQLVGELRSELALSMSELSGRLRECRGISDVYVWSIPFEADWFREAYEKNLQNDMQAASQHYLKYSMFAARTPLVRGRIRYLRGQFENQEDEPGAKTLLSQTRISEADLNQLGTNQDLQRHLGIQRNTSDEQQWQGQLQMFRGMLTETKQHASFWLGLCHLEAGRPDAAVEWLKDRSMEAHPNGLWAPLARYDLARAYEQQGRYDEAQKLLLADQSLQEHGNYLRARMLESRIPTPDAAPRDP